MDEKQQPDNPIDWRERSIKVDKYFYEVVVAVIALILVSLIGLIYFAGEQAGYCTNLYVTVLGFIFTIFILDRRAQRREIDRHKSDLIFRFGSSVNTEAIRASEELRRNGWLQDGSLRNCVFDLADLSNANLDDADLQGVTLKYLRGATLKRANLKSAILRNVELVEADLNQADLEGAIIADADLRNSKLVSANFRNANLGSTKLQDTYLQGANFQNAELSEVRMQRAYLWGADFRGANLREANMINASVRSGISIPIPFFDNTTILPDRTSLEEFTDIYKFTDPDHPLFWHPPVYMIEPGDIKN